MKRSVLILALCCAALVLSAAALWQNPVPILKGDNLDWSRCGAVTADGCMIYVWSGTARGDRDIFAQKVSASGNIIWQQPLLVDGKFSKQTEPVITRSTDNNFIIAWLDYTDFNNKIIRAQKITSGGQLLWLAGGIQVGLNDVSNDHLDIAADHNGGAYLIWTDSRNASRDVYAQHLDTFGNALWTLEGLPVDNGNSGEYYPNLLVDDTGDLIVAYQVINNSTNPLYVNWINSNGVYNWTQPLWIADCYITLNDRPQLAGTYGNNVIVTWSGLSSADSDPNIYAQKFDHDGYTHWGTNYVVYSDSGLPYPNVQYRPRIVRVSDIEVIIAWEDYRYDTQEADIFAQKIFADGVQSWIPQAVPVCMAMGDQKNLRLISNGSGGAVIVWDDFRAYNYGYPDIYAQNLSAGGYDQWEQNGTAICSAPGEQLNPMVRRINGNYFIGWMDWRSGSPALHYQVVNETGAPLLQADGKLIHQGLSSFEFYTDRFSILPRSTDAVVLWSDQRHYPNSGGEIIHFQFLNSDGTVDLEPNGRPLTLSSEGSQDTFSAIITPDDQLAVAWTENCRLKAQLIDVDGNRLWGENGMYITETEPLRQNNARISYEDGAFYIGWSELAMPAGSTYYAYRIFGQKLINGQKQWGPDGILVSVWNDAPGYVEAVLQSLTGRYFTWEQHNNYSDESYYKIMVKLLNPDGSTAQGWPPEGMAVSDYTDWDIIQIRPQALLTPAGLMVAWQDYRTDYVPDIYGQMLSPQGVQLWDSGGVNLTANVYDNSDFSLLFNDNAINLVWMKALGNISTSVNLRRISLAGELLTGDTDILISQNLPNQMSAYPQPAVFPNGGMLVAWEHHVWEPQPNGVNSYDLNFRYLNPDGSVQGGIGSFLTLPVFDKQLQPRLAVVGNEAYLIWLDSDFYHNPSRCDDEIYERYDIYAQKLSNEVVSNQDEISVLEQAVLRQNYPNPFTGATSIGFSLPAKGKARIDIYNVKGQKVNTILSAMQEKGSGTASWNGLDFNGNACSSGIYYCKLTAHGSTLTRKMLLIK